MSPEALRNALNRIRLSLAGVMTPKTLLVEDNDNDATLFLRALETHGLQATWVKGAADALEELAAGEYKIVFLDLKLPGGGEREVLDYLREHDLSCVVLTGAHEDDEMCKDALKRGANALMLKPLSHENVELIYGKP